MIGNIGLWVGGETNIMADDVSRTLLFEVIHQLIKVHTALFFLKVVLCT